MERLHVTKMTRVGRTSLGCVKRAASVYWDGRDGGGPSRLVRFLPPCVSSNDLSKERSIQLGWCRH